MNQVISRAIRLWLALIVLFVASVNAPVARAAEAPIPFNIGADKTVGFDQFSPSGAHLLFCVVPNSGVGTRSLYTVDAATQAVVKLLDTDDSSCALAYKAFTLDEERLFMLAPAVGTTDRQLWSATVNGSRATFSVSGRAPSGYEVDYFDFSPDGRWVVYEVRKVFSGQQYYEKQLGIYVAPTDGSAPARQLPIQPSDPAKYTLPYIITPDSTALLFVSDVDGASYDWNLYAVNLDGATGPKRLTPQPCGTLNTSYYQCFGAITADSRYSYVGVNGVSGVADGLYRVSLTGATPYWQPVSTTPMAGSLVLNDTYLIGHYLSNFRTMPVDGSQAPHTLVASLPTGVTFIEFLSSGLKSSTACGGTCVILLGTNGTSQPAFVIYRAPLDGSAPAQLLYSVPRPGSDFVGVIRGATLSPDRSRVFFQVDHSTTHELELYSLPVDGSSPAQRMAQWPGQPDPGYITGLWALMGNGRHVAAIDPPSSTVYFPSATQLLHLVDSSLVDGPRQLVSDIPLNGLLVGSPNGNQVLVYGSNPGAYYLLDMRDTLYPQRLYVPLVRK